MKDIDTYARVGLVVEKSLLPSFNILLQKGVGVAGRVGCSVSVFLREELGLSAASIDKIQSIVLDGSPVDDIESAVIRDGGVLALSAAMPGLVGATLRRGGAYASFRSAITYHETAGGCVAAEGVATVKVFNLLMAEMGPGLLRKGVVVGPGDLAGFAAEQPQSFWQGCRRITMNGKEIRPDVLKDVWKPGSEGVFLTVSEA